MCKHFSVKVSADYTENEGHVRFPFGECTMTADQSVLNINVQVEDDVMAQKAEDVIMRHLIKFAWKEELNIEWVRM